MTEEAEPLPYDRDVLTTILVYHWRKGIEGCGCGWAELGASWPEHLAEVYEASVQVRTQPPGDSPSAR